MPYLKALTTLCLIALAIAAPTAAFADWAQFMGPDRNGVSSETGLLKTWPESGPRVLWNMPLGQGYGGFAIRDSEVYVLDRLEKKTDVLRCISFDKGTELWNYSYDAPGDAGHTGSRTPPTVDEKYVYSVGMMGDFLCTDRKTHKPVWRKNLLTDFKAERPGWGVSQAPYLYKNMVIVAVQAPDAFAVAFDRVKGDVLWKSPGLGLPGYVSPFVTTLAGVEQLVVVSASNKAVTEKGATAGLSLKDGSVLWKYDGWQCYIPIPYPLALPGDRLFITGGYKAGSAMIQIKKTAKGLEAAELFKLDSTVCGSQIHQPIFYKDHLYVNSNSNERQDGLTCLALDGSVKWRTAGVDGQPNLERGPLMLADNMLLALDGKTGILHLIDPSPEKYKELTRAKVLEGKELWAPLSLTDGKLLVRSQDIVKCLELKRP